MTTKHYQDFIGLNTFIYEPNGYPLPTRGITNPDGQIFTPPLVGDEILTNYSQPPTGPASQVAKLSRNLIGIDASVYDPLIRHLRFHTLDRYKNELFPLDLPITASFFNALMAHRGNTYGYPTWRQIRVSNNPLTRKQRKENIFTYVPEPGSRTTNSISRYGSIRAFVEPVVTDVHKPASLIGEVRVYNEKLNEFQNRSVELKTSFGNETAFFANPELNDYYDTIAETDDNYEQLKELYIDGGLEDDGSPIQAFNLFIYRQSVYPKQQYAYLDVTRSRKFFLNSFWREERGDRTQTDVTTGFGTAVPSQSMWPLDVAQDWATRPEPSNISLGVDDVYNYYIGGINGTSQALIGPAGPGASKLVKGFNTGEDVLFNTNDTEGASGVLMNSYSQFTRGKYVTNGDPDFVVPSSYSGEDINNYLSSSAFFSRRHAMNSIYSVVSPSGMEIDETGSLTSISTGSMFEGLAAWDCGRLAGKDPFYKSYDSFATETRIKGKGFSTVPEFRISNHVEEYYTKGVTEELSNIFELSGALAINSTTQTDDNFYKVLSTSDFLKHFDLVKKDHKDLASEKILTLKCKAIKKFLPYDGFYPAQQTVEIAKEFKKSIEDGVALIYDDDYLQSNNVGIQGILEPLFAPGVLFNSIKSGIAVDYPIILPDDNPVYLPVDFEGVNNDGTSKKDHKHNYMLAASDLAPFGAAGGNFHTSIWSKRINFESLVEPEKFLANLKLAIQEGHPYGLREDGDVTYKWDGSQSLSYKKKINNFLAETADLFLKGSNFSTIASDKDESPTFGNATAGKFYAMRIKMFRSRNKPNLGYESWGDVLVDTPQDIHAQGVRETFTMYSRPSSFGTNLWGSVQAGPDGTYPTDSLWGNNYAFTPPYYYGEAWCDLIFKANVTKKYTLDEIMSGSARYPYFTRHWQPGIQDALRDLTGYTENQVTKSMRGNFFDYNQSPWYELWDYNSPTSANKTNGSVSLSTATPPFEWDELADTVITGPLGYTGDFGWKDPLITIDDPNTVGATTTAAPPQHPANLNLNAMQLDSSINIFGKGTIRKVRNEITDEKFEVASDATVKGKTRWIIQSKFETPMLNFNSYTDLSGSNCTVPEFASESAPRGIWHQYGELPSQDEGVFLQVTDIPVSWLRGAVGIEAARAGGVESLADLVGFSKEKVRLGEVADVKEISEAVVAVPFIEKNGTRQFFSIPRSDIDSCIGAVKREVEEGTFVAGGPPKAGDSVYQMVKKMQKYVFPPSMDFVRYKEIDPFAMYVFEFKHNLTKQDLSDIWQNLPPDIGTRMEEAEATISHELLAHELLGGGAVVKNGVLDDNAEGNGIPSNIQWMIFKAKKRAKTNYFDKVVAKKGTTKDTSSQQLENAQGQTGDDLGITYNWPYDFFSLVELVKIDAEVTFANIENDDKGQKTIKKVEKKSSVEVSKNRTTVKGINLARGKGKLKK